MKYLARTLSVLCLCVTPLCAADLPNKDALGLNEALQTLVSEHKDNVGLVGVGAMIMQDGEVVASAVAGERKHRSGVLLTSQDKWHIGSITKSFTATMIARLVERGELTWDTTVGDIFSDSENLSEAWQQVTVEQLLTHTSGASNNLKFPVGFFLREPPAEGPARMAARKALTLDFLKNDPVSPAGTTFLYSNPGTLLAGVMAEKISGLSWEDLIRQEIFIPLGIQSGGFGLPRDQQNKIEQPRGHKSTLGFILSVEADNSIVIGPAGSIHISLRDLLVYANDQLQGEAGGGKLLKAENYKHLHTPKLNGYAFGWVVKPYEDWASGPVIWHNGSDGHWFALLAIMPASNTVIAVTSNDKRGKPDSEIAWPLVRKAAQLSGITNNLN